MSALCVSVIYQISPRIKSAIVTLCWRDCCSAGAARSAQQRTRNWGFGTARRTMLAKAGSFCCAAREGKVKRYTAAVPSSDGSQTNAVPQNLPPIAFPSAEAEGLVGIGLGDEELSTPRETGSDSTSKADRTSKGRSRMVSPRWIIRGAARRITSKRSSRRSHVDEEVSSRVSRGSEATPIVDPTAFHDALIAGWLDCLPVPPGQSQLLGGDALIEAPKAKLFIRRWTAVWHDRIAWYDRGREVASLQLTHATVVAALAGNERLACLTGEQGVYLSFSDEAEAEAWAGHIRSAIEPLLAQQEELEKEEAPNTHGYHAHHACGLCTHMQHVVMHVRTRTCARAHAHAHMRTRTCARARATQTHA